VHERESEPVAATAASYDAIAQNFADRWFDFRLHEQIARFVDHLRSGARVLDLGCGPGRDVAHLQELGFHAVGVDLSAGMLAEGRRRGVGPLVRADMRVLPFADGSFNGLWCCASLLHVPKTRVPAVLSEYRRVLGHGHLFLAVKRGEGEAWVTGKDGGRRLFAYYHPAEIELLVERAGFQVRDCQTFAPGPGQSHPWINLLARTKLVTPRVGANAVIFNAAGQVLLTRRADNGMWCLPGGHLDFGESLAQTAVREILEETGLQVEVERLIGVYSTPYPDCFTINEVNQIVIVSFLCRVVGGELALSYETTAFGYFDPKHLPQPMVPTHPLRIQDALAGREAAFFR
jgi:ADP-ribose pyrophosphatase YjhB (NUDIX family)/2-polyprenyl-3-methyl-5-hydroxy-6-metoxy-1,4-benzoquinol methylase